MSDKLTRPARHADIDLSVRSGEMRLEVRLQDETVWLTQRLMSELYQVGVNTINHHIKAFTRTASCPRRQLFENIE